MANTVNSNNLAVLVPPLDKMSPRERYWAKKSMKLDFSAPDKADPNILGRVLWFAARGDVPYPQKYARSNQKNLEKLGLLKVNGNNVKDDD
jgi:hypothetical protein